jgi:hypothetical protein
MIDTKELDTKIKEFIDYFNKDGENINESEILRLKGLVIFIEIQNNSCIAN